MSPRTLVPRVALLLALLLAGSVHAQTGRAAPTGVHTQSAQEGYQYTFEDDPLAASPEAAQGVRLRVNRSRGRTLLLRPRTQFVREIFQSAENF